MNRVRFALTLMCLLVVLRSLSATAPLATTPQSIAGTSSADPWFYGLISSLVLKLRRTRARAIAPAAPSSD